MTLAELLAQIKENLLDTNDISVLSNWERRLATEYAWVATHLAEIKKNRATRELDIKKTLLTEEGKYTEKEIERRYYSTEDGMYLAWGEEIKKVIGRYLVTIRSQIKLLRNEY